MTLLNRRRRKMQSSCCKVTHAFDTLLCINPNVKALGIYVLILLVFEKKKKKKKELELEFCSDAENHLGSLADQYN